MASRGGNMDCVASSENSGWDLTNRSTTPRFSSSWRLHVLYTRMPCGLVKGAAAASSFSCNVASLRISVSSMRHRRSARRRSTPVFEHGASTNTRSNCSPRRQRSRCVPSQARVATMVTPRRRQFSPTSASRELDKSAAIIRPRFCIFCARYVVLPPGAAHISNTDSPGCGSRTSTALSVDGSCT